MRLFLSIIILFLVLKVFISNKLVIRIDTFFRKGFSKKHDRYRSLLFLSENRETGKTYSIIDSLSHYHNQIIITNVKSYYNSIRSHAIYEPNFENIYHKLKDLDDCSQYIIFYDEIFTLIEKGKLTSEMLSFLSQMRKRRLYFYTTCQEWLELNVTFRRYVRYQVECSMFNLPILNFALSINCINDAYQMMWDNEQNEYVSPRIRTTIKKCSKKLADSYDTFETIETQGSLVKKKKG